MEGQYYRRVMGTAWHDWVYELDQGTWGRPTGKIMGSGLMARLSMGQLEVYLRNGFRVVRLAGEER